MATEMKLLFVMSQAPHGSICAQEGLDAVLMGSAFSACSLLFIGAGVLQLVRDQDTELLGIKNFSRTFGALPDYGVTEVFCCEKALKDYQLKTNDLLLKPKVVSSPVIQALLNDHNQVLTF